MDITLIIGWILGIFLIINGIGTDKLGNFTDMDSVVIVLGGTVAALVASYPFRVVRRVPIHIKIAIAGGKYNTGKLIDKLVDMAKLARKNGLLVLEEKANAEKDPFLRQSIMLIVDAMDSEKIRELLEGELASMEARHEEQIGFYEKGSAVAPAFGMIGTLVGLINMLKGMSFDEEGGSNNIGNDMSVALITTFYGCVLANLIFIPMAKKLRIRNEEELLYKQMIIEGVLSIQAGDNPKYLEEKLLSYLSQKQQKKLAKKAAKGGADEAKPEDGQA